MDWNNGTIFRAFIRTNEINSDCKIDIGQQELNNKVFIGVENMVLKPNVSDADPDIQDFLQDFWSTKSYIQLESYQLPPYIDYTSNNISTGGDDVQESLRCRNTNIFARLPLIATPTLGDSQLTTEATFALDRVLNKDSILYEMVNNPHALSNGRLKFRILDEQGRPLSQGDVNLIKSLSFTLVIYKPDNKYN
tara:strand:+ start:558 stop:1136 length:579 start_codon:yes stop_codon:yes gene_type:complete